LKEENGGYGVGLRKAFVVKDTKCSDTFDQLNGRQPTEKAFVLHI